VRYRIVQDPKNKERLYVEYKVEADDRWELMDYMSGPEARIFGYHLKNSAVDIQEGIAFQPREGP